MVPNTFNYHPGSLEIDHIEEKALVDLGGCTRCVPPLRDPILSFWHTNFMKRSRLGSPRPPLREILVPPLKSVVARVPNYLRFGKFFLAVLPILPNLEKCRYLNYLRSKLCKTCIRPLTWTVCVRSRFGPCACNKIVSILVLILWYKWPRPSIV